MDAKEAITRLLEDYKKLPRHKRVNNYLLTDITEGIKDILKGNIEEV